MKKILFILMAILFVANVFAASTHISNSVAFFNGTIGIGVEVPTDKLEISGNISISDTLCILGNCTNNASSIRIVSGTVSFFNRSSCPLGWSTAESLMGRMFIATGQSSEGGATNHTLEQTGGDEQHLLTSTEIPAHTHTGDPDAVSVSGGGGHTHSYTIASYGGTESGSGNGGTTG